MMEFLKSRWVLLGVLVLFVACKIPHLFYPYYWDESWPYAPAIVEMYHHGISLMPSAVQPELSRGHPLFFHALAAGWMHIFGHSLVAMHSMALLISVLFLVAVYEAGLRFFNQRVAVLALLMVATQVLFFVQSSYVLFEMLVAFLAFLSLCSYTAHRYLLTAICLTALFYTKESGMIMGFVLGLDALVMLFKKGDSPWAKIKRILSVGVPVIAIGIFFLLQKQIRGWYIFPLYNDLIGHDWVNFWDGFRNTVAKAEFIDDYRYYYLFLLIAFSVFTGFRHRRYGLIIILVPAILLYFVAFGAHQNPEQGKLSFGVFMLTSVSFLYFATRPAVFGDFAQRKFLALAGMFILCFIVFSSLNFFTYRYLLASIVPLHFIIAALLEKFIGVRNKGLYLSVTGLLLLISVYSFKNDTGYGDGDLGGLQNIQLQKGAVDYLEQNNDYNASIGVGAFLEREHLIDSTTGFLTHGKIFSNVRWDIDIKTDIAVFDNIEPDYRYDAVRQDTRFKLVFRKQSANNWVEIYRRAR